MSDVRRARIEGRIDHVRANGIIAPIPRGPCTVSLDGRVVTLTWGSFADQAARFSVNELDHFIASGALLYVDAWGR